MIIVILNRFIYSLLDIRMLVIVQLIYLIKFDVRPELYTIQI